MSAYIAKVQSNIKAGVDVVLGPKTLIVGKNGSGKTSIINAIEMGLTQTVSDLRGRKVAKRGKDLITLVSKAEDGLKCAVTLSTNKTTTVNIDRTATGGGRAKVKGKIDGSMPFLEVRDILTSKPENLKKWIVERASTSLSRSAVIGLLEKDSHKESYLRLAGSSKADEVTILKKVEEKNNDKIKSYREERKASETVIEKLTSSLPPLPSKEEIRNMELQVDNIYQSLRATTDKKSEQVHLVAALGRARAELSKIVSALVVAEKEYDVAVTESNLSRPVSEQDELIVGLRKRIMEIAKIHMGLGMHDCMVCLKGSSIDFGTRVQDLDGMNQSIEEALQAHNKRLSLEKTITELRLSAGIHVKVIQESEAKMTEQGGKIEESVIEALKKSWSTSQAKLEKLKSTTTQWASMKDMKEELDGFEKKIEESKEFGSALKKVLESVAEGSQDTFTKTVQSFLPKKYTFGLEVGDDVKIGFVSDGEINEALSGAEWATMIMAMSAACSDSTQLNVITPEERAFDSETLYNVMESLSRCPYQVILTSTIAPTKELDGWTIVNL